MPLTLYTTAELLELPPPAWLIDGIFPERGFVALYGKPGDGKTFLALDMALSVALGRPWQGHTVQQGPVVYISAEGGSGIGKRVQAWLQHHRQTSADTLWLLQPITLADGQADIDELVNAIADKMALDDHEAGVEEGDYLVPALIVVDTLARCFMGDENLQEDMGNFIKAVDRLREEFHCAVLVIHHARLDSLRERGSTAFRGAADTLIRVEKDETNITVSCEKQKDSVEFEPMDFQLLPVAEADSVVIAPRADTHQTRMDMIFQLVREYDSITWAKLVEEGAQRFGLSERELNYPLQLLIRTKRIEKKDKIYRCIEG